VVFVVNDELAHARKVELGLMDGWKIEVKSGLKPGDRVIVVGHRDINPGQRVTVVKTVERIEDLSL
jgi:membrane fusion protein (multidrug efflux system)